MAKPEVALHAPVPGVVVGAMQFHPLFVVMELRQPSKGSASGPTGCRSCQVPLSMIPRIFSATRDGGAGS